MAYEAPPVRKAVRLIELLCDCDRTLGVSHIGERLGINKNMVFRILHTLVDEGDGA